MPRYPAFLARRFEGRGVVCTVDAIEDLSARLRRVHVSGGGLRGHEWRPCEVTSFRVNEREFRHYTPDGYDSAAGRMSILFYRHAPDEPTPAEVWLSTVATGDDVVMMAPGAARTFEAIEGDGTYLLAGDGSTVGLWRSLIAWLPAGAKVTGAVELPASEVELGRELLPGLDVLRETGEPGAALLAWLTDARPGEHAPHHTYLSGHGQTIQRLRAELRRRHGLDRAGIHVQPYWATGKAGL